MIDALEPAWLDKWVRRAMPTEDTTVWLPGGVFDTSGLLRVPRHPREIDATAPDRLTTTAVRNERRSGQLVVVSALPIEGLHADVSGFEDELSPVDVSIRYVEYLPIVRASSEYSFSAVIEQVADTEISGARAPDLVGDPLRSWEQVDVPAYRAQPIWITIDVPADASPGSYTGEIRLDGDGMGAETFTLTVEVATPRLPDPANYAFHLDVWANPNAIADQHDVSPWSESHWGLLERYFGDLAGHAQGMILTTICDQPWQQTASPFDSMVRWEFDGDAFSFDYDIFDRYVETAREHGVGPDIAAYSILSFNPPERVSYWQNGELIEEELQLGSNRWRECWTAFLGDFQDHLIARGWLEDTYLAVDERDDEDMEIVRSLLETVTPELAERIQIAGSLDTEPFAADFSANYTNEMPLDSSLVHERAAAGKRTTFYTAGRPNHPNCLAFSPAVEARMLPWIVAGNDLDGYLRWAYCSWPRDLHRNPIHNYVQGDEYLIYPGETGPDSSIRWELLGAGIQDFELVNLLRERTPDATGLKVALELATRDVDGRQKDLADIPQARQLVIEALQSA